MYKGEDVQCSSSFYPALQYLLSRLSQLDACSQSSVGNRHGDTVVTTTYSSSSRGDWNKEDWY